MNPYLAKTNGKLFLPALLDAGNIRLEDLPTLEKIQEREDRTLDNVLGARPRTVSLCRLLLWLKGKTPSLGRLHGSLHRQGGSGDWASSVRPNACNVEGHRG